jgi:hypothetical protein
MGYTGGGRWGSQETIVFRWRPSYLQYKGHPPLSSIEISRVKFLLCLSDKLFQFRYVYDRRQYPAGSPVW